MNSLMKQIWPTRKAECFYDDYSATDDELAPFIAEAEERQRQEEAALRVEYPCSQIGNDL